MSRAASLCRDEFQPSVTWGEPARLMADAMNRFWREEGASRSIYYFGKLFSKRTLQECGRRMIVIAFFQQLVVLLFCIHAVTWTFICFFFIERGILICWLLTLHGRGIYLLRNARD